MSVIRYEIPFEIFKLLVPKDGEVALSVTLTKKADRDKWPDETEPFDKNETFELVMGTKIQVKKKKRDRQKPWGPGIQVVKKEGGKSHILLKGGWRLHKLIEVIGIKVFEYFRGTFEVEMIFVVEEGKLKVNFPKIDIDVKGKFYLKVVEGKVEPIIEKKLTEELNKRLQGIFSKNMLKPLSDATELSVEGANFVISIDIPD